MMDPQLRLILEVLYFMRHSRLVARPDISKKKPLKLLYMPLTWCMITSSKCIEFTRI